MDMCRHINQRHAHSLPRERRAHIAAVANVIDNVKRREVQTRFCDACTSFFPDVRTEIAAHADRCEGSGTFMREAEGNTGGALPPSAAHLTVQHLAATGDGNKITLGSGQKLWCEEVGSVVMTRGSHDGQCCFYLSATRTTEKGTKAATALGQNLEESQRLETLRNTLSPDAAKLKISITPLANIIAKERGHKVNFAARRRPAEEEVHMAYATIVGDLTVVSMHAAGIFSATRYSHPERRDTPARAETFVFWRAGHFQALTPQPPRYGQPRTQPPQPVSSS